MTFRKTRAVIDGHYVRLLEVLCYEYCLSPLMSLFSVLFLGTLCVIWVTNMGLNCPGSNLDARVIVERIGTCVAGHSKVQLVSKFLIFMFTADLENLSFEWELSSET